MTHHDQREHLDQKPVKPEKTLSAEPQEAAGEPAAAADPFSYTAASQQKQPNQTEKKKTEKTEKTDKKEKKGGIVGFLKETVIIVGMALIAAVLIKTFVMDTRVIPTLSMYPTVDAGDRLIVNKLSYLGDSAPERGDVVVFVGPEELGGEDLLKRVIGLPGEVVEVREETVFIDGQPLSEDYLNEPPRYEYGPVEVPEGAYLMMGDNRNQSADSHMWQEPFIYESEIKGKAVFRYWPFDRFGGIYE